MGLHHCLLDEACLSYRHAQSGARIAASLPELFVALGADEVRDFPSLRPHQRHPWHAFLVQVAAIALHRCERIAPFDSAAEWRAALLALTPDQPDGAAWSLVAPLDQPALLQPPVPEGGLSQWATVSTPDSLDMLITSKNHDLKGIRMWNAQPEDWLYALLSVQTQEGYLGAGNYGISRMNSGYGSRPGLGVAPPGHWGRRWTRDIAVLLATRDETVRRQELARDGGHALVWLLPWDGKTSLSFASLDPFYIEVCRRIRLQTDKGDLQGRATPSKAARIQAKEREGRTGDAWTPIDAKAGKALTIATPEGFHYGLASELLFGQKYLRPAAQLVTRQDGARGLEVLAQAVARGDGKTRGYHERRIPISPKAYGLMASGDTDVLAKLAETRVAEIGELRKLLWSALCALFSNGSSKDASDTVKTRAGIFARRFETAEDARFFHDLNEEIEAEDEAREAVHDQWLLDCAARAEKELYAAFIAGPRSGIQRYRSQAAALSRFRGGLRGKKSPIPALSRLYQQREAPRDISSPSEAV
jgi:CRISPR system Cascade subunit CasA